MLREESIDARMTSETQGYTALDFAQWSAEQGVAGASEVAEFLGQYTTVAAEGQPETEQPEAPPKPPSDCIPGASHRPSKRQRSQRKYWLFAAASAGCLRCVRHYVEEESVDPGSKSDTHGWTVLDFAVWAKDQGVADAEDVETYLKEACVV